MFYNELRNIHRGFYGNIKYLTTHEFPEHTINHLDTALANVVRYTRLIIQESYCMGN